jgi:Zn-dependent protease with chaperone function
LLSLDPTAGFLSMGLIYLVRQLLSAAHSRQNELQADELGLQLAAAACFDTEAGTRIMAKMHQLQQQQLEQQPASMNFVSNVASIGGWMDSHPPSLERLQRMQTLATTIHNRNQHPECRTITKRLYRAMAWGP